MLQLIPETHCEISVAIQAPNGTGVQIRALVPKGVSGLRMYEMARALYEARDALLTTIQDTYGAHG